MENWLFLFLGLILAYLLDFTKPWAMSFYEKRRLSLRKKNIEYLKEEYTRIKYYKEHHDTLTVETIRLLAAALIQLTIFIFLLGIYVVNQSGNTFILVGLTGGGVVLDFLKIQTLISNVDARGFDKYKEKTIAKLKKLGGNPEDLDDKEDG